MFLITSSTVAVAGKVSKVIVLETGGPPADGVT